MKKIVTFVLILSLMLTFSSCMEIPEQSTTDYVASAECWFSTDNGQTYVSSRQFFDIGTEVLMGVRVNVQSNSNSENVGFTVKIPDNESVECLFFDGSLPITVYNQAENVTEYNFNILASENPKDIILVFKLMANDETSLSIKLEFDENIDALYDKVETIEFIAIQQ